MSARRERSLRIILAMFLCAALPLLADDSVLQYQKRGDRWEGLKPKPVSGYEVELLSALIADREPSPGWPPMLRLRFYLPVSAPVFVTVRQPRPKTVYYWLDKVTPPAPWRPQAFNDYAWSTEPVLKKLGPVTPDDLGAVVRLHREGPSKKETIAPAAIFHTQPPTAASGYRFTFKTNGSAYVTARIYQGDTVVYQRPQNREKAGSPFTLLWTPEGRPDGEYRLVLSGYFDDATSLDKEIVFHHRASWK